MIKQMNSIEPFTESIQSNELSQPAYYREKAETEYRQNTCEIASKVAYLAGARKSVFENPNTSVELSVYEKMDRFQDCRIVRALSILRKEINCNFRNIDQQMSYEMKNLHTIDATKDAVKQLRNDGVDIVKANVRADYYPPVINQKMTQYIDRCKPFFPEWIEFEYIRNLFVFKKMDKKAKSYFDEYMANINRLPYQVCINWHFTDDREVGNLLQSDQKFLSRLYEQFGDRFTHYSTVHYESVATRMTLERFADEHDKIVMVIDSENSDPLKVCAALQSLGDNLRSHLVKAILYNDVNSSSCWTLLNQFTNITIEHIMTERVLTHKSLVDATLIVGVCREYYENHVSAFLLVSSDSDFIALIRNLPEADFLFMIEDEKTSDITLEELETNDISYCSLDEFNNGGNAFLLKKTALLFKCQEFMQERFTSFNINTMMEYALKNTRIQMTEREQSLFMKKYINTLHVSLSKDGTVELVLGE